MKILSDTLYEPYRKTDRKHAVFLKCGFAWWIVTEFVKAQGFDHYVNFCNSFNWSKTMINAVF